MFSFQQNLYIVLIFFLIMFFLLMELEFISIDKQPLICIISCASLFTFGIFCANAQDLPKRNV